MRNMSLCLKLMAIASCVALVGCPKPKLTVSETSHNFGTAGTTFEFTVENSGRGRTNLEFELATNRAWLEIDVIDGELGREDDPVTITVTLNRDPVAPKADFNMGAVLITSNGGNAEISITATPEYFTEVFEGDFDLENMTLIFTEDARFDPEPALNFYDLTIADATGFVTDPGGGNVIDFDSLGDPAAVSPLGDKLLEFYGLTYDKLYVGSGGYVGFSNDTAPKAASTLEEHFSAPRISALGADLDPMQGNVSLVQSDDRIAITFENMVEVGASSANNFQIEVFFDGHVQVTYLDIGAMDAIAGLSFGEGLPEDFAESDLNSDTLHTTASLRPQL